MDYINRTMVRQGSKAKTQGTWRILLALLCVALVIVAGTLRVAHTHPRGDASRSDCALCATAHVVVQISTPPVTLHVTPLVWIVEALVLPARLGTFSTFALFTRPPPVDVALA